MNTTSDSSNWFIDIFQGILNEDHLVDKTEDIIVSPAGLVEVVRLLQHLRKLLASHISARTLLDHTSVNQQKVTLWPLRYLCSLVHLSIVEGRRV